MTWINYVVKNLIDTDNTFICLKSSCNIWNSTVKTCYFRSKTSSNSFWRSYIDAHPVPDEDCKVIGEIDQLKKSKYPVQSASIAPLFIIAYGLSLYPSFTNIDPLSTHILDTSFGTPKLGIDVHLHMKIPGNHWKFISSRYAEFLKHYNDTKIHNW